MEDFQKPTSILLFAAGLGTRMGALVADKPKPLVKVASQTLLDHALSLTNGQPLQTKVVNVHHKAHMIRAHLINDSVQISDESDMLRETGGGLKHALPLLSGDTVMTLNTDAVWAGPNPIEIILDAWKPQMDALLMTVPSTRAFAHLGKGDFTINAQQNLRRGGNEIYTGLQIIKTSVLDQIKEDAFSMNVAWDLVAEKGNLLGVSYPGKWCDVGHPESIPIAEEMLSNV